MDTIHYKYSFKVNERPVTSLSVYNTGLQRCDAGYTWGPGVRDHFLIHFVMSGKGSYKVLDKTFTLSEGDMFLAKPGDLIRYTADDEAPWSYCWVGFNGLDAAPLIAQTDFNQEGYVLHIQDMDEPRTLLLDIYEGRGTKPFEITRMTGRLYTFFAWMIERSHSDAKRKRQAGLEHVENACEFIARNYANPITVMDIASGIGVCRSLLNRAFQQHMDLTPVQYLTRFRMEQACMLLQRTDMPIKAVAFSVGFTDPLYFSRRFREIMGCSPREYVDALEMPETATQ